MAIDVTISNMSFVGSGKSVVRMTGPDIKFKSEDVGVIGDWEEAFRFDDTSTKQTGFARKLAGSVATSVLATAIAKATGIG